MLPEWLRGNPIREHIRAEYTRGLTDEGCLGYHGTSIYSIEYVLKSGIFPGATGRTMPKRPVDPENGDLYFWKIDHFGDDNAFTEAKRYASHIAQRHQLVELLGLDRANYRHIVAAMEFLSDDPKFRKRYLNDVGLEMDPDDLEEPIAEAYQHQGVIVGISEDAARQFRIVDVGTLFRDDGWRLEANGVGLPFNYIRGIHPLGQLEREFLDSI